jgi:hypothetical protein
MYILLPLKLAALNLVIFMVSSECHLGMPLAILPTERLNQPFIRVEVAMPIKIYTDSSNVLWFFGGIGQY